MWGQPYLVSRRGKSVRSPETVAKFRSLEDQLASICADAVHEARQLAADVVDPRTADPNRCWNATWRIPLYANARADAASRLVDRLHCKLNDNWQPLSSDRAPAIRRERSGNTNAAFTLGQLGEELCSVGGLARYRLFAIQAAARALEPWFRDNPTPFAHLLDWPVGQRVETLHQILNHTSIDELGGGPTYWGHVTVAHLLTDLGLGCKPDRQLNRAVRYLCLVDARTAKPPITLQKTVAVNAAVGELAQAVYGDREAATLRYVDKLLMEFSRQGIIDEAPDRGRATCRS